MRIHRYFLLTIMLLLISVVTVEGQKPQVTVSFSVEKSSPLHPFYLEFRQNIDLIKDGARDILIKGLNEYIGFAEFVDSDAPNKLEIELKPKLLKPTNSIEYYLNFKLNNDDTSHQWTFLSPSEFETLVGQSATFFLDQFSRSWLTYLQGFYNNDLVSKMFCKLALLIPDSTHYFVIRDHGVYEAILPFRKEELRLDPEESAFEVIIVGRLSEGISKQERQENVSFSGFVEPPMPIPTRLMGCIRIGLNQLPLMKLLHGKVFIIRYQRKLYEPDADTDDFLNGI